MPVGYGRRKYKVGTGWLTQGNFSRSGAGQCRFAERGSGDHLSRRVNQLSLLVVSAGFWAASRGLIVVKKHLKQIFDIILVEISKTISKCTIGLKV